ncbi:O-acetyl-ADP-ribose deacetylase (regulator of RNase III), contains Macro domain [Cyclobacterium lianum]|uniref:O-acetyl-ADP-ribose deacetylase (Regulator of RNase III), contains Macro domain n=1 Tax=Cyclobacterium lianum TaxID=388280 RepID=A0A1M7PRI3_9BACT|nr:macro domain-containing protein [Cyclobacterium lianum]SHN19934.1 O-acetyl-ADP-ribose deacetylase (regulator of RNase III), contains Macro domain [Cyclobacterium lianum]
MLKITRHNIDIELVQGDISQQPGIDAIVNAANAQLESGGGVAGAIHRAAGPGLADECRPMAPIKPGEAVISSGQRLPNPFVIHCLGPVYGKDKPSDRLLADCYRNALLLADKQKITSIAFPAISTGIFGYPIAPAAEVALNTILDTLIELKFLRRIKIVLFDQDMMNVFEKQMALLRRE